MKNAPLGANESPSERITAHIAEVGGWRGERLAALRAIITQASRELQEDWKWGTPVWSYKGNVMAAGAFADHVKLNFFKGASLADPDGLFNAGLDAKATRAIDFRQNDPLPNEALTALVRAAVAQMGAKRN